AKMSEGSGRSRSFKRGYRALFLAAAAVPLVGVTRPVRADLAQLFQSNTGGDYNTATTWTPNGVPAIDQTPGTFVGDVVIVTGGTNPVTISSDAGATQLYVGA